MKHLVIIFLVLIIHTIAFSQTKVDYEKVMNKFKKFYNYNMPDSINNLFSDTWGRHKASMYKQEYIDGDKKDFGKVISFTYLTVDKSDPERVTLFKTVCEKETFVTSLTLHEDLTIGTFRFKTSSPFIDSVFKSINR